jgi:hypothetical protein
VQVIESVLPSQAVRTHAANSNNGFFTHAGAALTTLFVLVPLLGAGAFQVVVWLLHLWVEMADSLPLLLAQ